MKNLFLPVTLLLIPAAAQAENAKFGTGPVITEFGQTAPVQTDFKIPKRAKFKVVFDTTAATEPGEINKSLNTAARFLNMHAKAGVAEKDMKLAVVFHSKGSFDLTSSDFYGSKYDGAENANAAIIKALTEKNVRVILCGQTAAYYGIKNDDLLPGVEMALSAMTAHAVLQQEGYTLNPF
ncbi:MAG: DsrE family protein [Litorimonas sp.]